MGVPKTNEAPQRGSQSHCGPVPQVDSKAAAFSLARGKSPAASAMRLMTMIAYAFLQHRRLATAKRKKKNRRPTTSANFARRTPRHSRPIRPATSTTVSILPKMVMQQAAA